MGREGGKRGERESTKGREFDGGNSRKRKTVTVAKWEKGRWIGMTEERAPGWEGNVPVSGRVGSTKGAGANEGFANGEIGYR